MRGRRTVGIGRPLWAFALTMSLVVAGACSVTTTGPGAPTGRPFDDPTFTDFEGPTGPPPGHWTGTITMHGVIDYDKSEPGHSDLEPTNVYYETWVTNETIQLDATDTYTINAVDDDDLTYGIHSVDLEGTASNSGSALERYQTLTDKQNSGCTWKQDEGQETTGSWSASGVNVGELRLSEEGSYSIDIRADTSGPGGESAEEPQLPHRDWLQYSDISANCEVNEAEYDIASTSPPFLQWVSTHLGNTTVTGEYGRIEGQLNAANPGSSVDGTVTWQYENPEGLTITVTWHLVHDSPIVLPHS